MAMRRIVVVGTSGSGKTTVATRIAKELGLLHVELDSIHWAPNWTEIPDEDFRKQVFEATKGDGWVADGNYSKVRDILWSRADTLVWLDLPFSVVFWRVLKRTISRIINTEVLWNENIERWNALIGLDSMPLWVIKTYWRRKREYSKLLTQAEYSHLHVIKLKTKKDVETWLSNLNN
jgi:adenylate kinase family enzyme